MSSLNRPFRKRWSDPMAQLIEIDDVNALPSPLTIHIGDVLVVRASGGSIVTGETRIERLGPFITGLPIGDSSSLLSPMGSPNTIMFLARSIGPATIEVATGDPYFNPQFTRVEVQIDP